MMGDTFRNRLKDGRRYFTDPVGVWVDGEPGVLDEDGDFVPDDPANDPSQEWTFVRDAAL
jgi:hypothetical protein